MTDLETIRHLYFNATKSTIQRDFDHAIDLIKQMQTEEEREKATVYMEGLAEMRSEWAGGGGGKRPKPKGGAASKAQGRKAR